MLSSALLLLGLALYLGVARPLSRLYAEQALLNVNDQVREQLSATLQQSGNLLSILAGQLQRLPPDLHEPQTLVHRFQPVIAHTPQVSSVVLGNDLGQGWMLLHQADGSWLARLTDPARFGSTQQYTRIEPDGTMQEWRKPLDYDPRNRAWYKTASQSPPLKPAWTQPYRFLTTHEPGITVATRIPGPGSTTWVLGLDVKLAELSHVALHQPTSGSIAIVLDEANRVLTLPAPPEGIAISDWYDRLLQPARTIPLPALTAWLRIKGDDHGLLKHFQVDERSWLAVETLYPVGKQTWHITSMAPADAFIPGSQAMAWYLPALALLLVAYVFVSARRQAQLIAQPLEQLTEVSLRISQLQFEPGPTTLESPIVEIQQLQQAHRHMLRLLHQHQQRIHDLAYYDELTDLPNRRLLLDRLQQALAYCARRQESLALMFIDLDHFKHVNDSLGHQAGDQLLKTLAKRLTGLIRSNDTLARLGGDEFVLLCSGMDEHGAMSMARKLLQVIGQPVDLNGRQFHPAASIGISLYPRDGSDTETLMRNADAAMYLSKQSGRNRARFYTEALNQRSRERLGMEQDFHRALEQGQFELHYQPRMQLSSGRIVGVEALVRWQHPDLGLIPPDRFIPVAEETGLILPLGEQVIHMACELAARLQLHHAGIALAVNLSPQQLLDDTLAECIQSALQRNGLPPMYLELEITESVLVHEDAKEALEQLKALGMKLALDDFGTGYSGLAQLTRLPLDVLKIDRSFMRYIPANADSAAIARMILSLAHTLGLKTVAEGVETDEQLAFLHRENCDEIQGYWLSPPLSADQLSEFLRQRGSRISTPSARI